MKTITFDKEPTFAQLWDVCVRQHLYDARAYVNEVDALMRSRGVSTRAKFGVSHRSKIIDTCAGGGFPAIDLLKRGYDVECMDASADQVEVFNSNAKAAGLDARCLQMSWRDTFDNYEKNRFDFAFCRGNSFIYAAGGWNEDKKIAVNEGLVAYRETLGYFANIIAPGGFLYLDKFKDESLEPTPKIGQKLVCRENVCDVVIAGEKFKLDFEVKYDGIVRRAALNLRDWRGHTRGVDNVTYPLRAYELEALARETGFDVERLSLKSEKHFDVWLLRKK